MSNAKLVLPKWFVTFGAICVIRVFPHIKYTPQKSESCHKKPAPEYPTAGAGVIVYSNTGKRISPVFSSVEKALMALGWPEVAVWTREKLVERMEDSPEVDG